MVRGSDVSVASQSEPKEIGEMDSIAQLITQNVQPTNIGENISESSVCVHMYGSAYIHTYVCVHDIYDAV